MTRIYITVIGLIVAAFFTGYSFSALVEARREQALRRIIHLRYISPSVAHMIQADPIHGMVWGKQFDFPEAGTREIYGYITSGKKPKERLVLPAYLTESDKAWVRDQMASTDVEVI